MSVHMSDLNLNCNLNHYIHFILITINHVYVFIFQGADPKVNQSNPYQTRQKTKSEASQPSTSNHPNLGMLFHLNLPYKSLTLPFKFMTYV